MSNPESLNSAFSNNTLSPLFDINPSSSFIQEGPDACALAAIVSPQPLPAREVFDLISKMDYRGGPLGSGFAFSRWNQSLLLDTFSRHQLNADLSKNYYVITTWSYNSDITGEVIARKFQERGITPVIAEEIPTNRFALNAIGLSTRPQYLTRFIATVEDPSVFDTDKDEQKRKELSLLSDTVARVQKEDFAPRDILVPSFTRVFDKKDNGFGGGIEIFKGVGTGKEIFHFYRELLEAKAKLQLGHLRFPTLSSFWWGGAHPFQQGEWIAIHNGNIISYDVHLEALKKGYYALSAGTDSEAVPAMMDYLTRVKGLPIDVALLSLRPLQWANREKLTGDEKLFLDSLNITFDEMMPDGPAGLIMTNGQEVYTFTGRHGVRPIHITRRKDDGALLLASELGAIAQGAVRVTDGKVDNDEHGIIYVDNGNIFRRPAVKTEFQKTEEVIHTGARSRLGKRFENQYDIIDLRSGMNGKSLPKVEIKQRVNNKMHQAMIDFGISREAIFRLEEEARKGSVIIESMGEAKPLPIFRGKNARFLSFFQLGASEVGDPSIDPDRMPIDTVTHLGRKAELDQDTSQERFKQIILNGPVLFSSRYLPKEWERFRGTLNEAAVSFGTALIDGASNTQTIPPEMSGLVSCNISGNLNDSLAAIYKKVDDYIGDGKSVLVLSDIIISETGKSVIPATLAVRLVDQYLKSRKMRHMVSLVVESMEITSSATVMKTIALGADAVSVDPRTVMAAMGVGQYDLNADPLKANEMSVEEARLRAHNLFQSWNQQLKKLMGGADITDINNVRGNRSLIQSIGLGEETARLLEINDDGIGKRSLDFFTRADVTPFTETKFERAISYPKHHDLNFALAVQAYRDGGPKPQTPVTDYFNLLEFKDTTQSTVEKESVSLETKLFPNGDLERSIGIPFVFGGASLGAEHIDWHKIFAQMAEKHNTFYNTGEGGWPLARYEGLTPESILHFDEVKTGSPFIDMQDEILGKGVSRLLGNERFVTLQFASGRWGINLESLRHAAIIEIKIAQGAKPGIGGHLPGLKVGEITAITRGVPTGSTVISPATHQNITSIEDLRAMISFLHEITGGRTPIQVKLAALPGMEWIAVGTARCGADAIVIDSFRGATGAAPWAQQNAVGLPLATAIARVDDALRKEGIRDKISLIGGGGIRTAREMLMLIALGADAAMAVTPFYEATGCPMCRGCHRGEKCKEGHTNAMNSLTPKIDIELGLNRMDKYIERLKMDMKEELARLGLNSVAQLRGRRDLLALIDNKETVVALDPSISYSSGADYSVLAAPLLGRGYINNEFDRARSILNRTLLRMGQGIASDLDEFDMVETLERVIRAGYEPGISADQERRASEILFGVLKQAKGNNKYVHALSEPITDLLAMGEPENGNNSAAVKETLGRIHKLNPLTGKLDLNRICGCIGECVHRQPTSGLARELADEFEWNKANLIPGGAVGIQPLIIDRTDIHMTGDRYVGVALNSAVDAFREAYPEAINDLQVRVTGQAGHDFAALAPLGTIFKLVKSKGQITGAGDGIGSMAQGGIVSVDGNGGDMVGYAARRGRIMISGSVDDLAGCNIRGTEGSEGVGIIIGGGVKNRAFESMSGGFAIVIGHNLPKGKNIIGDNLLGDNFVSGVFGGSVYVRAPVNEVISHIHPEHRGNLNLTAIRYNDDPLLSTELLRFGSEFGISQREITSGRWTKITSKTRNPLHEVYMEG